MDLPDADDATAPGRPATPGYTAAVKPPIGVMPAAIWREKRAAELARAIHEYVGGGFIGGDYKTSVRTWIAELDRLMEESTLRHGMTPPEQ